ncbi:DUF3108 domain-containing protein [Massilia sp.]|uniref:DUF3108 domain-containing protein n=1 Tax=Massilia sp. TaxID=1882437 RepID=UPI0028A65D81|nr:DUF3108 domain-containing protein [Massilia sp.]
MGIASYIAGRRRALVLGTLIVLLHAWLFAWIGGYAGLPRTIAPPDLKMVQTRLLSEPAPTPPPDAAPLPPPKPLPPPPLPELPPDPAPILADDAIGPPVEPGTGGSGEGAPAAGEGAPAIAAATPAAPQPEPVPAPEPAPAPPEPRRYKVDMPPPAKMTMDVARTDKDGTQWSGEAQLDWTYRDDTYHINFEAGIRVVFTRVNLAVLSSDGAVAATGFAPIKMTEKRRGRALTATHFDWGGNKISFSASQKSFPLAAGAQDKASVPLQLAAIARGDVGQLSGNIDMLVGEDREAVVFRFIVIGQEEIDTKLGKIQTWHLARPPKEGAYRSRLDVWLAPAHGWYPVRIRNTEANGAVTTQTVNNIALSDTGK